MNIINIANAIALDTPDSIEFQFKTETHPKLTKKSRATKQLTDFTVTIRSEFKAHVGANYEALVNEARTANGQTADFDAQKPFGKHYVNGTNWLLESDIEPGKFYIALSGFSDRVTKYFINDVEATPEQIEDLKANYLPKPSASPALVTWKTYSIESIVSIERV